ncbi:acetoacetate--CoA ligase [Alkalilimnicola ehrlichii]|uniref:Acetoacetate--CoA ligase n=1 Tax=Alkalilimnicola ehrlichii TaxID=351052 RepID=A0A3E0WTW4_9GAMM|nr:acetoacetate--CoA ligase [Alkalilimnicola ehrlichii]RFA24752.1 acetoacetate--CoA ligase [Alkalilimnicola ehrlichii]RFA35416.1 acetoacetate--CoA ligase [Alkalilimnicola ehrlichii]
MQPAPDVLWRPALRENAVSHMARYMDWLADYGYGRFRNYTELHNWSITEPSAFWWSVWEFAGLVADQPWVAINNGRSMPATRWLPKARLNFARNLLRPVLKRPDDTPAVIAFSETRPRISRSRAELLADVGALEAWLRAQGVNSGDRIAGLISNGYEALVGMLAATSLGAIWSSASPDFGVEATLDRFGQIGPKILIAVNGYGYGGKRVSRLDMLTTLTQRLPSLKRILVVNQLPEAGSVRRDRRFVAWEAALTAHRGAEPSFTPHPADHPVYILYSSGTTGKPKCIVHGAGGLLLNHAKELLLHGDIGPNDRLLYYTTCGWMMWNWQASALLTGASLVTYDGSPNYPDLDALWQTVADENVTHFGTSARFLAACRKAELTPADRYDFSRMRVVFSTGSPLLPEDYDWFYDRVSRNALLGSIAGGTDICGCFVGCNPLLPVRRGEIQCRMLGVNVVAYDEEGQITDERGELVCRQPLPSMPIGFWNDVNETQYRKAYFETFPGVWAHGDFVRFTPHGGAIIYGRSDATLNPGGVRIGTAEIYRQVETVDEIADSLVVGRPIEGDVEITLLVIPAPGANLNEPLTQRLRQRIRDNASPRHVPKHIVAVDEIPYTRSGKKMELAVTRLFNGDGTTDNRAAMANPDSLEHIAERLRDAGLVVS